MAKTTKIILILLFFILTTIAIYLGIKYYLETRQTDSKASEITLSGTIKKGKDIDPQKSYCPNELYIVTKDKTYQLRTPDNFNEKPTTAYAKYKDLEVKLTAKFQDVLPNCGARKDCGCDQFILIEKIKETAKADNRGLTEFKGQIDCLLALEGDNSGTNCVLGFKSTDGKYYLLRDIKDELIEKDKSLTILGELAEEKIVIKYKIDGMINVVEVK